MRARHLGGDVELEVGVERNTRVTEFNVHFTALLFNLFSEQGIKQGVECLVSVLKNNWITECNRILKCA